MISIYNFGAKALSGGIFSRYIKNYFLVDLADYFDIGTSFYINVCVLAIFIAYVGVVLFTSYYRKAMYFSVKQLLRHGADSEESAKTLAEIGLGENRAVKRLLSREGQLTNVVCRVGEVRYTYEEYLEAQNLSCFLNSGSVFRTRIWFFDNNRYFRM